MFGVQLVPVGARAPLTSPLSTAFAMCSLSPRISRGEGDGSALAGLAAVALAGETSLPFGQARAVELEDGLSGHEEEAVGRRCDPPSFSGRSTSGDRGWTSYDHAPNRIGQSFLGSCQAL